MKLSKWLVLFAFLGNCLQTAQAFIWGFFKTVALPVLLGAGLDIVTKIWPSTGEVATAIGSFLGVTTGRFKRDVRGLDIDMNHVNNCTEKLIKALQARGEKLTTMKARRERRYRRDAGRRAYKALPGLGKTVDKDLNKFVTGLVSNKINSVYLETEESVEELRSRYIPESGVVSPQHLAYMARQIVKYNVILAEMIDRTQRAVVERIESNDHGKKSFKMIDIFSEMIPIFSEMIP